MGELTFRSWKMEGQVNEIFSSSTNLQLVCMTDHEPARLSIADDCWETDRVDGRQSWGPRRTLRLWNR